jgi:PEGA domain
LASSGVGRILRDVKRNSYCIGLLLTVGVGGCVQQKLTLESEPSGALVYLNEQEVARTPATIDFTWYGKYDVTVRKEGYETLKTTRQITAPWWNWPPMDFFAELAPWRPTDRQEMRFKLTPKSPVNEPADGILARGQALKQQLPTTMPAK